MLHLQRVVVVAIFLLIYGCGGQRDHRDRNVSAPKAIGESFVVKTGDLNLNHRYRIGIRKQALDKEFLLQGELITQAVVAQPSGIKSRVVAFTLRDDQLFMLEATQGHSVTSDIPQKFVLARFAVDEIEDDVIYFDFNGGMAKIMVAGDWAAQDDTGPYYNPNQWAAVDLAVSYIESAAIRSDNNLALSQIAQIKVPSWEIYGGYDQIPVEARYYITPYAANDGFVPVVSTGFDQFGFFEVAAQLRKGGGQDLIYASRFDDRKPIVFSISANTPVDFIQAVKDGILYWNKAFGREVVQAVIAPEGVTAPDFEHNIVQWVSWDSAGYAYADAQMDPRSGEILHAQVFMTSVFAFYGKVDARQLLKRLDDQSAVGHRSVKRDAKTKDAATSRARARRVFSLAGFENRGLCFYQPTEQLRAALTTLIAEDTPDDKILKVSQDYVREVVAHEIGHTLGLRHNFAGSLYANFPLSARTGIYKEYLQAGHTPTNVVPTSSVMEYERFEESTLTGDLIVNFGEAMAYDTKAIRALYQGQIYEPGDLPPFCTDSHLGVYQDCRLFDAGSSIVDYFRFTEAQARQNLPYLLLEAYIAAKSPLVGYPSRPLASVTPDPEGVAATLLSTRSSLLATLTSDLQLVKVRHAFGIINPLNIAEVQEKEIGAIEEEIAAAGGLEQLLAAVDTDEADRGLQTFLRLLDSPAYSRGIGPGGRGYEFSREDKAVMESEGKKFFAELGASFKGAEIDQLATARGLIEHPLEEQLQSIMTKAAEEVVFASDDLLKVSDVNINGQILNLELPAFTYGAGLRVLAVTLLENRSDDLMWGVKARAQMKTKLLEKLNTALGTDVTKVAVDTLPDEVGRWVLSNRKVLAAIK